MNLWIASGNTHKIAEISDILHCGVLRTPADAGIAFNPEENGASFAENAFIKASALYALVRQPVIADDSGLCVDALDGRPGIYSARYRGKNANYQQSGRPLSDNERNMLLLTELEGESRRAARFVCAMVLLLDENRFFIAQETLEGEIHKSGQGAGGFGYDPIMYLPERLKTVAELTAAEKNTISHRAKAAAAIARILSGQL